jgi:hypothetical protein
MSSPVLKSFTFIPQPKPSSDPLIIKRDRMIARLEDQRKLLADPNFVRKVKRWERKEGGEKVLVESRSGRASGGSPIKTADTVMTVKVGSKRIEFEKGKAAIAVGTLEKLPSVIDALIKTIRAGELDEQLKQLSKFGRPKTSAGVAGSTVRSAFPALVPQVRKTSNFLPP